MQKLYLSHFLPQSWRLASKVSRPGDQADHKSISKYAVASHYLCPDLQMELFCATPSPHCGHLCTLTLHTHVCGWVHIETIRRPSFIRTWRTSSRVRHVLAWGHFDCSTCGHALLHIVSSFPLGRRFSSGLRLKRLSLEMLQHKQGLSVGKVSWLINICNASFSDTYFVIQKAR